jgi:hypothetical protein
MPDSKVGRSDIGRKFAIMAVMCGRYRLSRRKHLVEEYFEAVSEECEWNSRYNVAPSPPVLTIRQDPRQPVRTLSPMRLGLVPSWAKDPSIGYKTINVRSETVATTPRAENRSNRSDASFPQMVSMSGGGTTRACNRIVSR